MGLVARAARTGTLDLNSGPSAASSGTALMTAALSAALAAASTGGLLVAKPPAGPFAFGFAGSGMSFGTDSCKPISDFRIRQGHAI